MLFHSSRFSMSHDVPKYRQSEAITSNTENASGEYLLDIQSGEIVKELDPERTVSWSREFAFGVEFVSSEDERKFALVNKENELITDFRFDGCGEFSEGIAAASIKGRWGYIDPVGRFLIAPMYKTAYPFNDGRAAVQDAKTGKWGYIDKQGKLLFGFYYYLGDFSDGLIYAKNKDTKSYKFFNEKGESAILIKKPLSMVSDENIRAFHEFALQEFETSTGHCQLNDMGFKMINDGFYTRGNLEFCCFHDGLCQYIDISGGSPKIGFFDKTGNIAIPAQFDFVSRFSNGIALYSNGDNIFSCKSGILTTKGEKIEIGDFYWAEDNFVYEDKLFRIRSNRRKGIPNANGKYGLVDRSGKIVLQPKYDGLYCFTDCLFSYNSGFYEGVINEKEECVIPAQYDDIALVKKPGLFEVGKYGKHGKLLSGIMDLSGNLVAPVVFEELHILNKSRFTARLGDGYGLFDITGTPVSDTIFGSVKRSGDPRYAIVDFDMPKREYEPTGRVFRMSCGEGMYLYFFEQEGEKPEKHGHDFGLMNGDGKILTGEIFEHIGEYSDGLIKGQYSWKHYHYIDHDGNPVLLNFSDNCTVFLDGVALIIAHNWASGGLHSTTRRLSVKKERFINLRLPLTKPLDDGRQKFFINKQGDILNLSLNEQTDFLRKYYDWRKRKDLDWSVEEFVIEGPEPELGGNRYNYGLHV